MDTRIVGKILEAYKSKNLRVYHNGVLVTNIHEVELPAALLKRFVIYEQLNEIKVTLYYEDASD